MFKRARIREVLELIYNRLITNIPYNPLRIWWLRNLHCKIGDHVYLFGGSEVMGFQGLEIAGQCHVGRHSLLDGRGGLTIGRNVVIAGYCLLITADHDPQDAGFAGRLGAIDVGDRVWIGSRSTILKGVTLGEGAVVAAGAVVTTDVAPWSVVGGIPAKVIGSRSKDQHYEIDYGPILF
jgi:putative colanic acid biosynthesis acetyltransferase WcaF